jgi:2-methylisocitrate lyase-like PEP mutase family enzyme
LLAAGIGLVGGSIEDARADREQRIYDIALATERIAAAVQTSRSLPSPFTLAAREQGTFTYVDHAMTTPELNRHFPE